MKRLKEQITSDYLKAANMMRSKSARRRIVAYVESYDDIFFWRTILSSFENESRYFEVMLPSHSNLQRGKKSVLMNLISKSVGEDMIACVDADYDYLLQGATEMSKTVISNPYVFHTYVYAIENYQCYAPSLHNVAVSVTLNDHAIFDYTDYMKQFSEAIFPLFVWSIWHYRNGSYGHFTISDFNKVIELATFKKGNPYDAIVHLRHKVGRRIASLQRQHPNAKESYIALKDELKQLGVTPQTTYLYIQGHHLFDNIVVPMLKRVSDLLIRERETEIHRTAKHNTQRHNELSCYSHSTEPIVPALKRNVGYVMSEPFKRLYNDIQRFLDGTTAKLAGEDGGVKITPLPAEAPPLPASYRPS